MPVDFAPHATEKTTHDISMCRAMHDEDNGVDEEGVEVLTEGAIERKSEKIECFKRERTGRCGARGPNVRTACSVCFQRMFGTALCLCVWIGCAFGLVFWSACTRTSLVLCVPSLSCGKQATMTMA
jgi:hypothetical protein